MKIEVYSSEVKMDSKNYLSVWIYKDFKNVTGSIPVGRTIFQSNVTRIV